MKNKNVYIRVDGNAEIGLGHLMRCIALSQMLKNDFCITFFCKHIPNSIVTDIKNEHFYFQKIENEEDFFSVLKGDETVVLDNYFFDTEYQKHVKSKGSKLVCIDDLHDRIFFSDVVINPSENVQGKYESLGDFALYNGLSYSFLREAFIQKSGESKSEPQNSNVLLCLGGADINNFTLQILQKLAEKSLNHNVYVVLGAAYKYQSELEKYIHSNNIGKKVFLYNNISAAELVGVMQNCSFAICSASSVAIEYMAICKGALYVKKTADNQKDFYDFLIETKLAYDVDLFWDQNLHKFNHKLQDELFDGKQGLRISEIFKNL